MFKTNYPSKIFETKSLKRIQKEVKDLIETPGAILTITGEIGAGKTVAVFEALGEYEEHGNHIIWIKQPDRERLKAGSIMSSMIRVLGEEPRRDADTRTEQLRRLLGEKSLIRKICLVIDDAHALTREVLRSLKRLLELGFGKRMGLFSIVLIGTQEFYPKLRSVPEIYWRSKKIDMKLLSKEEASNFSLWVASWEQVKLEQTAADYLSNKFNNPLIIASVITLLKDQIQKIGETKITREIVKSMLYDDIKAQMNAYGISQKDIAQNIGVSEAVVSKTLSDNYPDESKTQKIIDALENLKGKGVKVRL